MIAPNTELNDPVKAALLRNATPEGPHSGYSVDGYEVHTHPDLVERLRELMVYAPGSRFEYVFGTPTLQNLKGDIFAAASGTFSICLRLEGENAWGRDYEEFGAPWRQGSAWSMGRRHSKEDEELLAKFVRIAYSSVQDARAPS